MKVKETTEPVATEVRDLLQEFVKLETKKWAFLYSAKKYYWLHGYSDYAEFFCKLLSNCEKFKLCLFDFIISNLDTIDELSVPAIVPEFESKEKPFQMAAELEDECFELMQNIAKTAIKNEDTVTLAYILPKIDKFDHLCCRAYEAIKNDQNPKDLIGF